MDGREAELESELAEAEARERREKELESELAEAEAAEVRSRSQQQLAEAAIPKLAHEAGPGDSLGAGFWRRGLDNLRSSIKGDPDPQAIGERYARGFGVRALDAAEAIPGALLGGIPGEIANAVSPPYPAEALAQPGPRLLGMRRAMDALPAVDGLVEPETRINLRGQPGVFGQTPGGPRTQALGSAIGEGAMLTAGAFPATRPAAAALMGLGAIGEAGMAETPEQLGGAAADAGGALLLGLAGRSGKAAPEAAPPPAPIEHPLAFTGRSRLSYRSGAAPEAAPLPSTVSDLAAADRQAVRLLGHEAYGTTGASVEGPRPLPPPPIAPELAGLPDVTASTPRPPPKGPPLRDVALPPREMDEPGTFRFDAENPAPPPQLADWKPEPLRPMREPPNLRGLMKAVAGKKTLAPTIPELATAPAEAAPPPPARKLMSPPAELGQEPQPPPRPIPAELAGLAEPPPWLRDLSRVPPAGPSARKDQLEPAPGRPAPPGGNFVVFEPHAAQSPLKLEPMKGDWDQFTAEFGQGQFDANYNSRAGLVTRAIEDDLAQKRMFRGALERGFSADEKTWNEWREYGKNNPQKVEVIRKLRERQPLTDADRAELAGPMRAMYERLVPGQDRYYGEHRSLGLSAGDLGDTYTAQRSRWSSALNEPELTGGSPIAEKGVADVKRGPLDYSRTYGKGTMDAVNALHEHMQDSFKRRTIDQTAKEIRGLAEQARAAGQKDVADHLTKWVDENVYEFPSAADIATRSRIGREILKEPVDVGMEFESDGTYGQPGAAKVVSAGERIVGPGKTEPVYQLTINGEPALGEYTKQQVLSMKHSKELAQTNAVDRLIGGASGLAARRWMWGNWRPGIKAAISNPVRNMVASSVPDFMRGAAAAKDYLAGQASPEKLQFYLDAGVFQDSAEAPTAAGKMLKAFDRAGNVFVETPDRISKIVALESKLDSVMRENPGWDIRRVEAEAIRQAAQQSDLKSAAFRGTRGRERLARIMGFFQSSTVNQASQFAQLARGSAADKAKAAALLGIPAVTFGLVAQAGGGDFLRGMSSMIPIPLADAVFGQGVTIGGDLGSDLASWGKVVESALRGQDEDVLRKKLDSAIARTFSVPAIQNVKALASDRPGAAFVGRQKKEE
jgi:hypothetical protein